MTLGLSGIRFFLVGDDKGSVTKLYLKTGFLYVVKGLDYLILCYFSASRAIAPNLNQNSIKLVLRIAQ
jgi:hypothetical protein